MDELKQKLGARLASTPLAHGEQSSLARSLGVSARTLRNWRARAMQGASSARGPGRPRASGDPTWREVRRIVREWRGLLHGHNGWRTLLCAARKLEIERPLRTAWVQELVKRLKEKRARRARHRIEGARQSVTVLARNVMWSSDESFLVRDERGEVRAHVVRETLAPKNLAIAIGPPATAEDLIALWETAARARGGLPLVIALDNSGPGRSEKVQGWLKRNEVVALFNLPRTPQHNPFVERTIGELKCAVDGERERRAARAGEPVCAPWPNSREALLQRLLAEWAGAAWDLNAHTPRPKLNGLTADELDSLAPDADDFVCRARFYRDACAALARAAAQHSRARARRRAQRECIYRTMERHRLLTRTRGGQPLSRPSKRNGIS